MKLARTIVSIAVFAFAAACGDNQVPIDAATHHDDGGDDAAIGSDAPSPGSDAPSPGSDAPTPGSDAAFTG